jgi:demethylmenaquinone methyltransferase/2-methoxy-6-polyprenyl-1,4-benzoquinol methylase
VTGTRHDYEDQAALYDDTRSASPSILRPLLEALDGAPGPRLLDVGGGTGNYARAIAAHGFDPVVADVAPAMLARAHAKRLPVVRGDAAALPFRTSTIDAVLLVSMLHLVPDWPRGLAEAWRVLRPGGRLALLLYAREHLAVHWIFEYFPASRAWVVLEHQRLADVTTALPDARVLPFEFAEVEDGALAALCRRPELILDPARRARTSYFERLAAADPTELSRGLDRLAHDLSRGRRPDEEIAPLRARWGDGVVVAWRKS